MPRPSMQQLQQQVQQQMEAEGIVEPSEKIVLQDGLAIKHKLDQTASDVSAVGWRSAWDAADHTAHMPCVMDPECSCSHTWQQ